MGNDEAAPQTQVDYNFWDADICAAKLRALDICQRLNTLPASDAAAREAAVRELFGSVGANPFVHPGFNCDNGKNIHVGDEFLANCNVAILDVAQVRIGDHVMLGPNVVITTSGHPISPAERREHLAFAQPVTIGDDVWMGGNVVVLPGVTIGSNVIVAAGAVVNKDVPSNCIVAGVPARKVRDIQNDVGSAGE